MSLRELMPKILIEIVCNKNTRNTPRCYAKQIENQKEVFSIKCYLFAIPRSVLAAEWFLVFISKY